MRRNRAATCAAALALVTATPTPSPVQTPHPGQSYRCEFKRWLCGTHYSWSDDPTSAPTVRYICCDEDEGPQ